MNESEVIIMAVAEFSQLRHRLADELCTGIASVDNGEDVGVMFYNGSDRMVSLMSAGGYNVIYDINHDRLVVAWCLRLSVDRMTAEIKGSWGQGYYFDVDEVGCTSIRNRYKVDEVVDLFSKKALGV